jgi:hypothetical protein
MYATAMDAMFPILMTGAVQHRLADTNPREQPVGGAGLLAVSLSLTWKVQPNPRPCCDAAL